MVAAAVIKQDYDKNIAKTIKLFISHLKFLNERLSVRIEMKVHLCLTMMFLQVTFSEKKIKQTHTHIRKSEIFEISRWN